MGGDIKGDVIANNKTLNLQMLFVDENFFKLFSFPLLRGDANTALNDISSVVITETVARKYFNSIDVVGKTMNSDADPSAQKLGKPMTDNRCGKRHTNIIRLFVLKYCFRCVSCNFHLQILPG